MLLKCTSYKLIIIWSLLSVSQQWETIGEGVEYRSVSQMSSLSNNVLITYAGYQVNITTVWTDRLLARSILAETAYGVRHAYSVRGPRTVTYCDLELGNSRLLAHLYSLVASAGVNKPRLIVVIAHSSGSYVANEFFQQLFNYMYALPSDPVYSALSKRIAYYNLDGDAETSRTDSFYVRMLFSSISFVWASQGSIWSMNSYGMIAGTTAYQPDLPVKSVELKCPNAQCMNGKCLHDAVIIQVPWDPNSFDTAKDYTQFSDEREVQSDYIKVADLFNAINS